MHACLLRKHFVDGQNKNCSVWIVFNVVQQEFSLELLKSVLPDGRDNRFLEGFFGCVALYGIF